LAAVFGCRIALGLRRWPARIVSGTRSALQQWLIVWRLAGLSAGEQVVGATQVDGHAHQEKLSAVSVEASVADPVIAIGPLHQAEQAFDLAADRGQRDVHPLLPARLPAASMPSVHQRSDDPGRGQRPAPGFAVVSVGGQAVADIGAGEDGAAHNGQRKVDW
jgi:hypothetical protein